MSAENRLGPSDRPMAWTPFEPSNACLSQCQAGPDTSVPRPLRQARPQRCDVEGVGRRGHQPGAPGVDGVEHRRHHRRGPEGVASSSTGSPQSFGPKYLRPKPLRRVHIPKPGNRGKPGHSASPPCATGWSWRRRRSSSSRSSRRTSRRRASGSARSVPPTRPSKRSARRPTRVRCGCSTPTSKRASTRSTTTPSWARSSAGSSTGRC